MAVATTSGPQQQVNMPAVDLRRFVGTAVAAEGIRTSSDLQVAQRAAGANMSVDVSAGAAYIQDDHGSGGGFYHGVWSATANVAIAAADPTNPRIDRIVARVRDQFLGDATNAVDLFVVQGTPTAGATLVNLNGAAAVPSSCLLLANVLVGAAAASILTANIGNVAPILALVGAAGVELGYTEITATAAIAATTEGTATTVVTAPAITFDGVTKVIVELFAMAISTANAIGVGLWLDGTEQFGHTSLNGEMVAIKRRLTPAAGSRTFSFRAWDTGGTGSVLAGTGAAGANSYPPAFIRVVKA